MPLTPHDAFLQFGNVLQQHLFPQLEAVVGRLSPHLERLIFRLDTVEGVRPSVWPGLQVGNAEFDRIQIVRRSYRFHINDPKNLRSRRVAPLTSKTAAILEEYRKLLVDDRPDAWLFPSENPKSPMDYRNVFRRYIKPALEKIGLTEINYQAMRRTSATQQKAANVDAKKPRGHYGA
jgi:integrase